MLTFFKYSRRPIRPSIYRSQNRSHQGNFIAELGPVLWVLFIALAFPAMCYASLFYRASLLYFATRDACYKCAKSSNYTTGTTNGQQAFNNDKNSFSGISGTCTFYIVTQPLAGGTPAEQTGVLSTIDQTNNVYFIKALTAGVIDPLFTIGPSFLGISIPGLNGPYNLNIVAQFYVENPNGLTN